MITPQFLSLPFTTYHSSMYISLGMNVTAEGRGCTRCPGAESCRTEMAEQPSTGQEVPVRRKENESLGFGRTGGCY